ncbi:MAG: hypothetical protein J6V25_10945 [Oscillospiraceae bacterium]|nr:hypothetical protein [Oscillospiraceae bacterium]
MPNRIIKESIARSEKISGLTDFQFRLWVHLITYVDDFGRGDARAAIIKGACFPFRERLANKDIEKGIAELADAGCVGLYKVDGKPYLYLPNWDEHQRVRNKVSKFPSPEDADENTHLTASCGELLQDAARIQNPNPESRIQNPNPESKPAHVREDVFEHFANGHIALAEALEEFEKMRKQIKKPLTNRAKEGICKKLITLSGGSKDTMAQILDQSTLHCWQDVYALKQDNQQHQNAGGSYVHGADRLAQMIQRGDFDD